MELAASDGCPQLASSPALQGCHQTHHVKDAHGILRHRTWFFAAARRYRNTKTMMKLSNDIALYIFKSLYKHELNKARWDANQSLLRITDQGLGFSSDTRMGTSVLEGKRQTRGKTRSRLQRWAYGWRKSVLRTVSESVL